MRPAIRPPHRRWLAASLPVLLAAGALAAWWPRAEGPIIASLPLGIPPYATAVDQPAHTAFIASAGDGRITMLDMRTGALLRTVRVGRYPTAIVVARPQGRVFVASDGDTTDFILRSATIPGMPMRQGTISVLDARSGALLRTAPLRLQPFQLAVDERAGRVLVMNYSGKSVILLDAGDGTTLAERRLGVRPIRVQVDAGAGRAIVAGGCCAIAPAKGVAVVDTHTGRVLGGSMTGWESAIALDTRRGRAYLSNSPGLQVLDIRSGQPLPNLPLGLPNIEDDLALDAGTDHLYIATRSRDEQIEVVRVRLPAGHPTQIVRLGPYPPATGQPTLLTLDAPRKRLYLSVGLRILVLDAATCRQIAAIPLPFASSILALDPSTGYLLVAGEDPPGRRWQSSWPGWLASLPFAPPGPAPNPHHALILDPVRLPALRAAH